MTPITFYVAARCEKAGRQANQDSFVVCPDLDNPSVAMTSSFELDHSVTLDKRGALLLVADGMGGMNAGDKASQLIVEGITRSMASIPEASIKSPEAAVDFLGRAIASADMLPKEWAMKHPECQGMGSTLAMAWLLDNKAVVAWVGDSRVYRFNPANGLVRLSHDHSYVQSLVDVGKITEEEAFDHPDSNIITRSLGDNNEAANPQFAVYDVYDHDMLLLCSDGLCGLLPEQEIERIMRDNASSTARCLEALWSAAESRGFTDNCTIVLARVSDGGLVATATPDGFNVPAVASGNAARRRRPAASPASAPAARVAGNSRTVLITVLVALVVALVAAVGYLMVDRGDRDKPEDRDEPVMPVDSPAEDGEREAVEPRHVDFQRHESGRQAEPRRPEQQARPKSQAEGDRQTGVKATKVPGAPVPGESKEQAPKPEVKQVKQAKPEVKPEAKPEAKPDNKAGKKPAADPKSVSVKSVSNTQKED